MSDNTLDKAESTPATVTRPFAERGQPQILTSTRFIQDQRKTELQMPKRFWTFDKMAEDDSVANSIDVTNILVTTAMQGGEFVAPKGSSSGKIAAEFLNYCIRNMGYGTWLESMNNAATDLKYGFSIQNIVIEKAKHGQFKGTNILKKLSPRDQKTVYGWVYDKNLRDLKGFVQKPNRVQRKEPSAKSFQHGILMTDITNGNMMSNQYPFIHRQQMLHFRHNPTNNNPQGDSPLTHIYDAWMEKKLVERYEVVGVSKDLGGAVVLRVPAELIERANDPVTYPLEAAEYQQLQKDAGALHAGESSFIVLTSDVDETTKTPLFDFELKGIDGGGKQYNTSDIIDQKRKSIYNMFGTGFLLTGQSGHGSNALSSNQMTTHDYYVNRSVMWKVDVLNNQLAPRLLAINNIELNWKDMPTFIPADPSKPDLDVISKVLQRADSVDALTPAAFESLYKDAGWSTEGLEEYLAKRQEAKDKAAEAEIKSKTESQAGKDTGGTSGASKKKTSSSSSNTNNSVSKQLHIDGDKLINTATGEVVNLDDLNEEGEYA